MAQRSGVAVSQERQRENSSVMRAYSFSKNEQAALLSDKVLAGLFGLDDRLFALRSSGKRSGSDQLDLIWFNSQVLRNSRPRLMAVLKHFDSRCSLTYMHPFGDPGAQLPPQQRQGYLKQQQQEQPAVPTSAFHLQWTRGMGLALFRLAKVTVRKSKGATGPRSCLARSALCFTRCEGLLQALAV
eukprot:1158975-Pelagomonas_calceolata.AAC.10